jgi:tRNA A-37 threonylcarbamoyl transferase component Bud32
MEGFRVETADGVLLYIREGIGGWIREGLIGRFENVPPERRTPIRGRGAHFTFESPDGRVLVRTVRRGGWLSFMGDRLLGAGRVFNELRMLDAARRAGMSVPEPLGYSIRGRIFKRATVVYREIEGARTLDEALREGSEPVIAAAKAARDLHDAGILHGDLNCRNVLLREGRAILVDFDRARPCRSPAAHRRELARLFRSLAKELGDAFAKDARALLVDAYSGAPDPGLLEECERRLRSHRRWWALGGGPGP